ncbi:MAG TPA: glycosyltransferase family 39 protein [Candidatus Polarisedimenticolia bacterium]|nr:glycosyltransferase family 39 protein [Candidatus Polarisedimenticolia bacterium]
MSESWADPLAASRRRAAWIALLLVCSALVPLLLFLDRPALLDPDESAYAESVREMVASGNLLVPRLYGRPLFDKPILYYWILMASFRLFGWSEVGARLPSALAAFGGLLAVYRIGSRIHKSRRAGILSAVILASSFEYFLLARAAVTDMILTSLCTLALMLCFEALEGEEGRIIPLLAAACLGAAVLVKGPVGFLVPLLVLAAYLVASGRLRHWRRLRPVSGAMVFAGMVLPWFGFMARSNPGLLREFLLAGNLGRFLTPEHRSQPLLYYPVVLFAGFLPWSAWLPAALWRGWSRRASPGGAGRGHILLLAWLVVPLVFFSMAASKLPSYILPALPAAALLVGGCFEHQLVAPLGRAGRSGPVLLMVIGTAMALLLWRLPGLGSLPEGLRESLLCASLAALAGALLALFFRRRGLAGSAVTLLASGSLALMPALLWGNAPRLTACLSSREAAEHLAPRVRPGDALVYYRESDHAGLAFYLRKTPIFVDREADLVGLLSNARRAWCLMEAPRYEKLRKELPPEVPLHVAARVGDVLVATNAAEAL